MKDWPNYLKSRVDSSVWAFAAVDRYYRLRDSDASLTIDRFIKGELIPMLASSRLTGIDSHRALLAVCAQLVGNDPGAIVAFSLELIRSLPVELMEKESNQLLGQMEEYGLRRRLERLLAEASSAEGGPGMGDRGQSKVHLPNTEAELRSTRESQLSYNESRGAMKPENSVDIVVLTALFEERDAVLRYVRVEEEVRQKGRAFHRIEIGGYDGILLCLEGMGTVRASAITQQAIAVWNPAHVILTGIAGGVQSKNERLLGDVLVAEQVVDYELGKLSAQGLEHRYQAYRPARPLLSAGRQLRAEEWALSIHAKRPDGTSGRVVPNVHFGVIGSGNKVVTDPEMVAELRGVWVELIGVEMEGIGVALASYESDQAPGFLMVKGISDWADPTKGDNWRQYAAEASAAFVAAMLKARPFESVARVQALPKGSVTTYPGKVKIVIARRLISDWENLADYFDIPPDQKAQFRPGREPQAIWEWLQDRNKLGQLKDGLQYIERPDLAQELSEHESDVSDG